MDDPIIPDCPDCRGAALDLYQPDEQDPETVIGQCPVCGSLYACAPIADAIGWQDPGGFVVVGRVGLLAAG